MKNWSLPKLNCSKIHFKHWQYEFKDFSAKIKCLQISFFFCNPSSSQHQDEITFRFLDAPLIIVILFSFTDYNDMMSLVHGCLLLIIFLSSLLNTIVSASFFTLSFLPIEWVTLTMDYFNIALNVYCKAVGVENSQNNFTFSPWDQMHQTL